MRTIGCLLVLTWSSAAAAQAESDLPPAPPPPPSYPEAGAPPAEPTPAPPPAEATAPAAGATCTPACRAGFVCLEGQCVSACNPPCTAGEQCSEGGQCVAQTSGSPPNTFFSEPEPDIPPPADGVEQHDGFMLRLTLGFGTSTTTEGLDDTSGAPGSEFEYTGFSGTFSLDLGGSPTDNLVIHARLADFVNVSPTISMDGDELADDTNLTVTAFVLGAGVTYYFMPINLYVTGVVGPSWISFGSDDSDRQIGTDAGLGLNFDLGKEWWVGDNWGLGVAGRLWYNTASRDLGGASIDYTLVGFALMFSATYQ